jgi:diguanylate cyclase (GGDEF)-like protein
MRALAKVANTYRASPVGLFTLTHDGCIEQYNPAFQAVMGLPDDGARRVLWSDHFDAAQLPALLEAAGSEQVDIDLPGQRCDGVQRWYHVKLVGSDGALEGSVQDITENRADAERLRFLADHDPLTELLNRRGIEAALEQALVAAAAGQPAALAYIDLDRFKLVNDLLGHGFGDQLLRGVAQRLRPFCEAPGDMLARLGGDEFALLLDGVDDATAVAAAHRVQRALEEPMHIDDQTVDLGASIGIAVFPRHGRDAGQLLSRAELAMYAAKRLRCGSQVYEPRLDAGSQESLTLLGELRHAVGHDELRLFLQPKVDLRSGTVVGAEALVRWQHPQRGLLPPGEFIAFAEQAGFVRHISTWMVAAAARAWRALDAAGNGLCLSVNLSPRDLMDADLAARLAAIVRERGAAPQALCLEITEGAIMEDPQRAQVTLEQLSRLGFRLSIDDFGTGYSSLAYLKRLAVDELKVDKSFVMAIERDHDDVKIVRSTIELAHNLGLSVAAEGLETARSWQLLDALGCDQGQGYYIARPMPEAQFATWLERWCVPDVVVQDAPASLLAGLD